jgi:competence protein ComGC
MATFQELEKAKDKIEEIMSSKAYQLDAPGGPMRSKVDPIANKIISAYEKAKNAENVDAARSPQGYLPPEKKEKVERTTKAGMIEPPSEGSKVAAAFGVTAPELAKSGGKTAATIFYSNPVTRLANDLPAAGINFLAGKIRKGSRPMQTVNEYLYSQEDGNPQDPMLQPQWVRDRLTAPAQTIFSAGAGPAGIVLQGAGKLGTALRPGVEKVADVGGTAMKPVSEYVFNPLTRLAYAKIASPLAANVVGNAAGGALLTAADKAISSNQFPTGEELAYGAALPALGAAIGGASQSAVNPRTTTGNETADMAALNKRAKQIPGDYQQLEKRYVGENRKFTPEDEKVGVIGQIRKQAEGDRAKIKKDVVVREGKVVEGLADEFKTASGEELKGLRKEYTKAKESAIGHPEASSPVEAPELRNNLESVVKYGDTTGRAIDPNAAQKVNGIIATLFPEGSSTTSFRTIYEQYRAVKKWQDAGAPTDRQVAADIIGALKSAMFATDPSKNIEPAHEAFKTGSDKLEEVTGYIAGKPEKEVDATVPQDMRIASNINQIGAGTDRDLLSSGKQEAISEHSPAYAKIMDEARASAARRAEAADPELILARSKATAENEINPADERFQQSEQIRQDYENSPEQIAKREMDPLYTDLRAKHRQQEFSMSPPEAGYIINEATGQRDNTYIPHRFIRQFLKMTRGLIANAGPAPETHGLTTHNEDVSAGRGLESPYLRSDRDLRDALSKVIPQLSAMRLKYGSAGEAAVQKVVSQALSAYQQERAQKEKELRDAEAAGNRELVQTLKDAIESMDKTAEAVSSAATTR